MLSAVLAVAVNWAATAGVTWLVSSTFVVTFTTAEAWKPAE